MRSSRAPAAAPAGVFEAVVVPKFSLKEFLR